MKNYRSSSSRDFSSHRRAITLSNATMERDDDLELFDYMRKREKELLQISDELGRNKISSSLIYKIPTSKPMQKEVYDDFLTADGDKHDYDWLLTPPGTPRLCSSDMEAKAAGFSERENPVILSLPPLRTSRLPNLRIESSSKTVRGGSNSRQITPSYGTNGLTNRTTQKPSVTTPKSAAHLRSSTPSSRSIMYASKPSYGNDGLRNTATPKSVQSAAASRSSTPSSRSIVPASKPSWGIEGLTNIATRKPLVTTPKSAASSRSSTPSSRSILPASKPSARPSMQSSRPPCRSSTPRLNQTNSAPPPQSFSVSKASIMSSRNSAMSQGTSLTVKTRPLQPSLIIDFSLETPPNLRTTMPEKAALANRGRSGAPSSVQCTTEALTVNRPRRQSRSPNRTKERVSYDRLNGDRSSLQTSKLHSNYIRCVTTPVILGGKMVEKGIDASRSVSQGKVTQATTQSVNAKLQLKETVKSISPRGSTGFGRTLSKPALDMALKHMDIRQSTPGTFRSHVPIMSNSSEYSVQAGAIKSKRSSIYDSPIATSSNESSEYGASIAPDPEWSAFDDNDFGSERGNQYNRTQFQRDGSSTNWLSNPEYGEKYDQSLFSDKGIEILSDPVDNAARAYIGSEYYKSKIGKKY